jgi:hypothetical protein
MSSQAQAQSPDAVTSIHLPAASPVAYHAKLGADCAAPSCEAPACGAPACDTGCGEAGCGCATNSCCGGCGSCGGLSSIFGCCTADPWTLKSANGFNYGGWVQVGWQDRDDGAFTGNGFFPNQSGEHGGVRLNQLYSFVEKVADGSCGLDWGMRFDAMYGVDGNEAQAFGNVRPDYWDFRNGFGGPLDPYVQHGPYEIALPQAYAQVALGNLSTKIGHFYTPIGYELVTSPGNFFLSRQITFYNSEPFTHTGVYSTYTVSDKFNFSGGWVQGMDTGFYQYDGASAYLGGYTWVASDFLTINHYFMFGNLGWRGQGGISSFIASLAWTDRLSTVHQFDFLGSNATQADVFANGSLTPVTMNVDGVPRDSTGFINYAFYQLTDCVKLGTRIEWYKADGDSYYTWTNGVNFKIGPNMVIRPEARYMWSNTTANPIFSEGERLVWGADWIFTF